MKTLRGRDFGVLIRSPVKRVSLCDFGGVIKDVLSVGSAGVVLYFVGKG